MYSTTNSGTSQKKILVFLLLILIPCLLTSCLKERSGEPESLEYVSMWTEGEPQALYFLALAEEFEAKTGLRIRFHFAGREILTSIRGRMMMNDPPDLIDQDLSELYAAYLGEGEAELAEIDGLFTEDEWNSLYDRRMLDLYARDGHYYFLPYDLVSSGFFYNKDLFREKGLDVPESWDDFMDLCFRLKIKGYAPLALDSSVPYYNAYYYSWFITRLAGGGAFSAAAADPSLWGEEDYLMAARYVASLSSRHYNFFQDDYQRSIFPLAQKLWSTGEAAFMLNGSWLPSETTAFRDFTTGYFPFPVINTERSTTEDVEIYMIGSAIPRGVENRSGAEAFLRFMTREESAVNFTGLTGNASPLRGIPFPEELADLEPHIRGARSFQRPYDGVLLLYPDWFSQVFYPLNNRLIFGELSPEEFIGQLEKQSRRFQREQG